MNNLNLYLASSERSIKIKTRTKKAILGVLAFLTIFGLLTPIFSNLAWTGPELNRFTPYSCELVQGRDYYLICVKNETKGSGWGTSASADPGDVLLFSIYYHNGIEHTVAQNTRVSVNISSGQSTSHTVSATLSASNANSLTLSDSINLSSAQTLQFIQGSAEWYPNESATPHSFPFGQSGNELVSGGVNLGDVQGCWEYAGWVYFEAKVGQQQIQQNKDFSVSKQVRNVSQGQSSFVDSVNVNPGETVEFLIVETNTGNVILDNARVRDELPGGLNYVAGSATADGVAISDTLVSTGTNIGDIPVGGSKSVKFRATVAQENYFSSQQTVLTNTAFARYSVFSPLPPEKSDTATVIVERQVIIRNPNLEISKKVKNLTNNEFVWLKQTSAHDGDKVAFSLQVTSTGDTAAQNVRASDSLPWGLSYVAGSTKVDGISVSDGIVGSGISLGSMSQGSSKTITFEATVNVNIVQTVINYGYAQADSVSQKQDTASVVIQQIIEQNSNLSIAKTVRNISSGQTGYLESVNANQGEQVRFKIDIQNTGNVSLSNLIVRDSLPYGFSYISGSLTASAGSGFSSSEFFGNGTNLNSLGIGSEVVIIFDATVNGNNQTLTNIGFARADQVFEKQDLASVFVSQTSQNPNLSVQKTVRNISNNENYFAESTSAKNGDRLMFRIEVGSTGNSTASNVVVSDSLPFQLNYVSGSTRVDGNFVSDQIISGGINLGSISQGNSRVVTFEANVSANYGTSVLNYSFAQAENVGQRQDSATININQPNPVIFADLMISKTVRNLSTNQSSLVSSANASGGDRVLFSIQLTAVNTTVQNIRLFDNLPHGLSYVNGSGRVDGGYISDGLSSSGINLGTMFSGQVKTITFEATVSNFSGSQTLVNYVNVSADNVGSRSAQAQVVVSGSIIVSGLNKSVANLTSANGTATDNVASVGHTLQYSISYQNNTNITLNNVQIFDTLPIFTSFISAANNGSYNSSANTIIWTIGTLAPGSSVSVSYQARVSSVTEIVTITNQALLRASGISDVISNETRTEVSPVKGAVVKAVSGSDSLTENLVFSSIFSLIFLAALYFGLKYTNALRALKLKWAVLRIRFKEGL